MEQNQADSGVQTELLGQFQETSRQWLDRVQTETKLASELASKLTAARSVPEVMAAYQDWGSRWLQLMGEDTVNLYEDTQRFIQSGARLS